MSKIYILVGLPGSGKSTWRSQLKEEHVAISTDDLLDEWAAEEGKTYDEIWKTHAGKAEKIAKIRFKEALNANKDIVIDRTNMTAKGRRTWLKNVPDSYEKIAVVFTVPDNVLKERLTARSEATGKTIPDFVINRFASIYTRPLKEDGFDKVIDVKP